MQLEFGVDSSGIGFGTLTAKPYRHMRLSSINSVWYRKPIFDFRLPVTDINRNFAREETRSAIDGVFSLLNGAFWVNDLHCARRARVKAQQLVLAGVLGMKAPRTIATCDFNAAMDFVDSCPHGAIAKTIYSATAVIRGLPQAIPTQLVTVGDLIKHRNSLMVCPVQFQEYVPKRHELRVTVIGRKIFAAKIESQKDDRTRIDWRPFCHLCEHSLVELPDDISEFCLKFLDMQQLSFGAFDIIVTEQGEHVFLENNPFGQYLWIEEETGAPLTEAMADLLISGE